MFLQKLALTSTKVEALPPDETKAAEIFSRIGYKIEEALADLVDNSIDAKAKNILIRFVRHTEGIHSVLIVDDGEGMGEEKLLEAMRFGSRTNKGGNELGKYGIGLKAASLSQAQTVTVISKKNGRVVGRRWTTENIKKGWQCEILLPNDCEKLLSTDFGPVDPSTSGTVVIWQRLEHLKAAAINVEKILEKAAKAVTTELGIKFHRFIEASQAAIYVDTLELTESSAGIALPVLPLNPFGYDQSGSALYPRKLHLKIGENQDLVLKLHVWPPKTKAPGYRLGGGKVASRQGFYFYRNDRLIQAGGWNGLQADDSEPHMSLARVEVDLPHTLDSLFKLNIGKSLIDPPPQFQALLETAGTGDFSFRQYLKDADATYRKQKKKESSKFPFTPGKGFAPNLRKKLHAEFTETGVSKPQEVSFIWSKLGPGEVFHLDAQALTIHLNSRYRAELASGNGNDGATLKLLLLLVLQNSLGKSFMTEASREWLTHVNNALLISMGSSA